MSKLVVRCLRENLPDFSELPDGVKGVAASKPGSGLAEVDLTDLVDLREEKDEEVENVTPQCSSRFVLSSFYLIRAFPFVAGKVRALPPIKENFLPLCFEGSAHVEAPSRKSLRSLRLVHCGLAWERCWPDDEGDAEGYPPFIQTFVSACRKHGQEPRKVLFNPGDLEIVFKKLGPLHFLHVAKAETQRAATASTTSVGSLAGAHC